MLSSASWAVLVTGFPTLLEITSPGADAAEVAIVILAVSVTRSPIMIPLQAFQGVLITTIADTEPSRRLAGVTRILGTLLAGGTVLAEGAFTSGTTSFTFPATSTQSIVIWVTDQPTAPDGESKVTVSEITFK